MYIYIYIFTFMNRYETSHFHRLLFKGTIKCLVINYISILTSRLRIICTIFDATPVCADNEATIKKDKLKTGLKILNVKSQANENTSSVWRQIFIKTQTNPAKNNQQQQSSEESSVHIHTAIKHTYTVCLNAILQAHVCAVFIGFVCLFWRLLLK